MKYLKINNFCNQFNQPDYKGLDRNEIFTGSQLSPENENCYIVATSEELSTLPADVEEITEEQYVTIKNSIQSQEQTQQEILAQTIADLTLQGADLQGQIQTLSQTMAQMQLG